MTQQEKIDKVNSAIRQQLADVIILKGINSLILSVCLVDTLAGFYGGYKGEKNGNRKRYLDFVTKYLSKYKDDLYDIRCNLAHSFSNTVSNYLFIDSEEFSKLFPKTIKIHGQPTFHIDIFKGDLSIAMENYFNDLKNPANTTLITNFNLRFDHLNILESSVIPTVRNLKCEMIKNISDCDLLPGTDIKIAIYDPTQIKK